MRHQTRKRICILGSTGSIGENTLRVIKDHPERFEIVGLSAHRASIRLAEQALEFGVRHICLVDADIPYDHGTGRVLRGKAGLIELLDVCQPDLVVVATVGYAGLAPTLKAIHAGVDIALANKEVLVTAGHLVMKQVQEKGIALLPVDSEHNALFQCLAAAQNAPLRRLILTASGGPFRGFTRTQLQDVTLEQALAHPTWSMGKKITIDSATMMNKGFEVIEGYHLFQQPVDAIEVVIHPQSAIHSLVEFHDGSMIAQMGVTDMYLPIAHALGFPERLENRRFSPLDLAKLGKLEFFSPDPEAFPCLRYAYESIRLGASYPTALNAANEVAVEHFLKGEIGFLDIPELIESALSAHRAIDHPDLDTIAAIDAETRHWCDQKIKFMLNKQTFNTHRKETVSMID